MKRIVTLLCLLIGSVQSLATSVPPWDQHCRANGQVTIHGICTLPQGTTTTTTITTPVFYHWYRPIVPVWTAAIYRAPVVYTTPIVYGQVTWPVYSPAVYNSVWTLQQPKSTGGSSTSAKSSSGSSSGT